MQNDIQRQIENVVQCRKHLAEVEDRRNQHQQNVPAEIWQEFIEASHRLEQAEERLQQTYQELIGDVNHTRGEIISALQEYNLWREQMRQVEDQFLANIVRPGLYLKQAIRQREQLEREYERIHTRLQREGDSSQVELNTDIRRVLAVSKPTPDLEEDADDEPIQEEELQKRLYGLSVKDVVEAISREELIKEFKRIVLPRVHPDTSNASPEVFKTVYEVYKNLDTLLMEAYIVEYQGEVRLDSRADPLESLDQVLKVQERYGHLSTRLKRRLERLKQELTPQEMEEPGKILENFQQQRQEILARIQAEAEQILYWREKIEGLGQMYREAHERSGEGK